MKYLIYILTFLLTNLTFGQTVKLTESEIEKYVKSIDQLKSENKLVKVSYPNMSFCGGNLDGYYLNKNLVLIDASHRPEHKLFSRKFYIDQDKFLKVIYREHLSKKINVDANLWRIAYTDTIYSIVFDNPTVFHVKVLERTPPNRKSWGEVYEKTVSNKINQTMIDELVDCGQKMKLELQGVIQQIDSLKFVEKMPYICRDGICGDNLYWEAVRLGQNGIELLIDKLDDTTSTSANVPGFGYNYTVADIAFVALQEIIHDIPAFELLEVPFDEEGCGYCSYWQHLNKNFTNRQKFKAAVREWYHKNKDKLIWVKSYDFATCDCKDKHPNGGHFKLKTD